jgi:hypothetical protein
MKKLLLILAFAILSMPAFAAENVVLQGSVLYNVESARKQAFDGLPKKLDKEKTKPFWHDANHEEHMQAIKEGKSLDNCVIMTFTAGIINGYTVVYDDKPEYAYYYTKGGTLAAIDYDESSFREFPYKIGKYNAFGTLISVGLYISEEEQYVYSKDGKLIAHWIGDIGYNAKGKEIAKRKMQEK